ncbi:phosphotransferase enzyme family protein [Marinobacterium rhizophilum]|uniref:phosphotransferase enzyme family protein n=1 Tax=Marinobacterium rhizophilum TaxID=420402 RepID=UPI00036F134A|nr:phosphotransferase [Marinobacterium rhizophilum]
MSRAKPMWPANDAALEMPVDEARLCQLAAAAMTEWSLTYDVLTLVKYRENAVFRVGCAGGRKYALRLHRPGYHGDDALRSELRWIAALNAQGLGIPAVIPTRSGGLMARTANSEGRIWPADLFEWVDGEPLRAMEPRLARDTAQAVRLYRNLGGLAARIHNQATGWLPPGEFRRHCWDAEGLAGERPFWGPFWSLETHTPDQAALLRRVREQLWLRLSEYAADSANNQLFSLIHADLVPDNLIVDGDAVRLIDFDDAGFGWHLFEIATALFAIREQPYRCAAFDALLDGYRQNRPLADEQLRHLPMFIVARACSYLGWIGDRPDTDTARERSGQLTAVACELAEAWLTDPRRLPFGL